MNPHPVEGVDPTQRRTRSRVGKLTLIVVAVAAAMVLITIVIWLRSNTTIRPAEVSDTPAGQGPNPKPVRSATTTRPAHVTNAAAEHHTRSAEQPGEVQILVATGYRRLQQRDFEAARDAFEEALSIDPGNSAAREGLRATQTAETVDGVAGVFGR